MGRDEASYRCSVVTHTLLLSTVGIRDFAWVETESESESVHVVVLVFLLPLAVAGLADSNATLAHFVAARAPHVNGIVHREGTSTVRFVGKVLAAFDAAGDLPFLLGGLGFGVLFAGVFAVLSRLGFESHATGSLATASSKNAK